MKIAKIHPHLSKVLYDQLTIEKKISELAQWVDENYKNSKDLLLIGILKGSLPFLSQLIKGIKMVHEIDFMIVSSYVGTETSGSAKVVLDLQQDILNKDILVIEEIVESGITVNQVVKILKSRNPKSLRVLSLIDKPFRKVDVKVDKAGFFLTSNDYLVGYGLDYRQKHRNLPYIGVLNQEYLDDPLYRK